MWLSICRSLPGCDPPCLHGITRKRRDVGPDRQGRPRCQCVGTIRALPADDYLVGLSSTAGTPRWSGWRRRRCIRLAEASLYQFVQFIWTAVIEIAVKT
jgi:hypothetical protein